MGLFSPKWLGRPRRLLLLALLDPYPAHQIEPRHDRVGVDELVPGVIAEAGEAKALDHDRLAAAVGITGIGGAAGHLGDVELAVDLGIDRLPLLRERAAAIAGDEGRAARNDRHRGFGV